MNCILSAGALIATLAVAAATTCAQVWQDLGPGRIDNWRGGASGRVSAVGADPADPCVYYLGGADGGVWKTVDNGATWTPLTDGMPANSTGCITVDPSNPSRIYVGTGEPNREGHCRYGLGVYRSDDGGTTWAHLPRSGGVHVESTFDGRCIGRICIDPANTNHLFAAVTLSAGDRHGKRHANGENPRGLYTSSDAGETWAHVGLPSTDDSWGCTDAVHVSGSVFLGAVWYEAGTTSRIYRTTDAGDNWIQVGGTFSQRILLAPATGGLVVWALDCGIDYINGAYHYRHRLWRSGDGGKSWSVHLTHDAVSNHNTTTRIVLAVNPADGNKVYFGGDYSDGQYYGEDDLKRVVYPSTALAIVGPPHEDLRAIGWRSDGHLMIGNDGGLEISINTDPMLPGDADDPYFPGDWRDCNAQSLGITQIVPGIAVHPTDDPFIYGGTQDNGSVRRFDLSQPRVWEHTWGGDGGPHVSDTYGAAMHTRIIQFPWTGSAITHSDNDGATWLASPPPNNPNYPPNRQRKYTQILVDGTYSDPGNPDGPHFIYIGRNPVTVAFWDANQNRYAYEYRAAPYLSYSVAGLAFGPYQQLTGFQRLYVTYDDDNNETATKPTFIAVSDDGGASFDANKPNTPSSDFQHWNFGARNVALDPLNTDAAFCVSSRWRTGTVPSRVFYTRNGGLAWAGRDGSGSAAITAAPCNAVALVHVGSGSRRVFVGTDQGVWVSLDDGLHWGRYGIGLPNSSVDDIIYDAGRQKLLVATLGRGIWCIDYPAAIADIAGPSGEGIPDGKVDEHDLTAFTNWMGASDLDSMDAEKQDLRADADGDGLVTVKDGLLFLDAYKNGY